MQQVPPGKVSEDLRCRAFAKLAIEQTPGHGFIKAFLSFSFSYLNKFTPCNWQFDRYA